MVKLLRIPKISDYVRFASLLKTFSLSIKTSTVNRGFYKNRFFFIVTKRITEVQPMRQ